MKISNVFTLLCCLLLCCFGMEIKAQGNSENPNTQQYSDDEFEFEFEVELIYADDVEQDDDDSDDNDSDDDDDDDDSEEEEALIGVQINVENTGESIIDANIFFRAHLSDEIPETTPHTYDAEEILYLLDLPLQSGESREVFIDLSEKRGGGRVVIVWPLIDADKSGKKEDTPFVSIIIPKTEISDKVNLTDFVPIKTYPNPTTGMLNIDIPNNISVSQITIYNETGQAIKTFDGNKNDAIQLDLSDLPRGVYFAAMKNEQRQTTHYSKVFIHR